MPGWQAFYERNQNKNFELIATAIEFQGEEASLPYIQKANASFINTIDTTNFLGKLLDFKVVPNGVFIDEQGFIRFIQFGGFTNSKEEIVEVIQKLVDGEIKSFDSTVWSGTDIDHQIDPLKVELIDTLVRLGQEYLANGKKELALEEYEKALELDPDSFVIRKQIWVIRYPEKFHPEVDYDWQRIQLAKERQEEKRKQEAQNCVSGKCYLTGNNE